MISEPAAAEALRLRQLLARVQIDGQDHYVAEGDLLLTDQDLATYAQQRLAPVPPGAGIDVEAGGKRAKLIGIGSAGRLVRWAPGVALSFYVAKETFTEAEYRDVRSNVIAATEDWMGICGVTFQHLAGLDDSAALRASQPAVFHVRAFDARGRFIAAAFFPTDPPARRRVLIDPSYFRADLLFDQVGVLRHELGHVLGFRHEHIRSGAPPECPKETLVDTIDLTVRYDPQSVMHYFCGNVGSKTLAITDVDREGARKLYGPPLSDFDLVEP